MRNEQKWKTKMEPIVVETFSPRIQRDLKTIITKSTVFPILDGKSYYLYGPSGHGKTITSVLMMLGEMKRMYLEDIPGRCAFLNSAELFNLLKKAFDSKKYNEQTLLQMFRGYHLLVIDDLGSTKPSDWALNTLYLIINYRYENLKPTIINSNLSLKELSGYLEDDRIPSRIERMCTVVEKKHFKNG